MPHYILLFITFIAPFFADCGPGVMLFSGSSNPELTQAVANCLGMNVHRAKVGEFNDGEIRIQIEENVRGCDVFILQSTCPNVASSVNDNLIQQTMYLVATAMGLAPCANGGGDSDLFSEVSGLDYLVEGSVGEFVVGTKFEVSDISKEYGRF